MGKPTGRTIILYDRVQIGVDPVGRPVYEETPTEVDNVLIGEPTDQEVLDVLNLTGKRTAYVLAIPKGDFHIWTDRRVELPSDFPPGKYRVIGKPIGGQEELIPLSWNKKARIEMYE